MKKVTLLTLFFLVCITTNAQVGIGTTTPNTSSALDIDSGNSGLLIPRVSLADVFDSSSPVTTPATSLMVYNTNPLVSGGSGVGYYYWSGTKWTKLTTTDDDKWSRNFNSIFPALLTDRVGIGTNTPLSIFHVKANYSNIAIFDGDAGMYITLAENGVNRGFIGSYNGNPEDVELAVYPGLPGSVHLSTQNFPRLTATSAGNVGVGTTNPLERFHVVGNIRSSSLAGVGLRTVVADANGTLSYTFPGSHGQVLTLISGVPTWQTPSATNYWARNTATGQVYPLTLTDNVGIGTANPAARFEVNNTGTTELRISSNSGFGATRLSMFSDKGLASEWRPGYIESADNGGFTGRLDFYTNGTGAPNVLGSVRALSLVNGLAGIGTTTPVQKLDVQGGNARINNVFVGDVGHGAVWAGLSHYNQANTTGYGFLQSTDGVFTLFNKQNTGSGYIGFRVGNVDQAVITNAGNMGVGNTNPAQRLDVSGKIRMNDGTQAANKVLTSDAGGSGSWQNVGNIIQTWQTANPDGVTYAPVDVGTTFAEISSITTMVTVSSRTRLMISAVVNMYAWQFASAIGGWGEIRIELNGTPLSGASLRLYNLNDAYSTGTFSNYQVDVNPGTYTIRVVGRSIGTGIAVDFNGRYMSIMGLPIN